MLVAGVEVERHPSEVVGPAFVVALWVAFSPALYHSFFALRGALLLVVLVPTLIILVRQARGDRAARAAVGLGIVAVIAAAASPWPEASLWGESNAGTGLLFVLSLLGLWAWGRTFTPLAQRRVRSAMFFGLIVNVAVAGLQQLAAVPETLAYHDRPFGLSGNAVHLGALCAATAVLALGHRQRLGRLSAVVLVTAGAGVQLAGGRSALALLVLALILVGARASSLRHAVLAVMFVGVGLGAAALLPGEAPTATARAAAGESSGSFEPRIQAWRAGAVAIRERPLLGAGPGRFRAATSPHRTLEAARADGDARFADAHNLFVELTVALGALGLIVVLLWLGLAARRLDAMWAQVALVLLLAQLVEPMSVAITPLTALVFGIAGASSRWSARSPRRRLGSSFVVTAPLTLAATALAAIFVVGEIELQRGSIDFAPSALASAERLIPPTWPTAALVQVRVEGFYGAQDLVARRSAVAAARRAVDADPSDDASWTRLGALEGVWGSKDAAAAAYDEALRRNPWSLEGLRGRAQVAVSSGDDDLAARLCRRLRKATADGRCANRSLSSW